MEGDENFPSIELANLQSTVKYISDELTQLESSVLEIRETGREIHDLLNDMGNDWQRGLRLVLVVIVIGIVAILGTLRHWF
jgi:hypothetical protein